MKILHVITSLRTGGAEKLMVDLLPRLRDAGHEVELCVFDGVRTPFYEQLASIGVTVHALSVGGCVYNPWHIFRLCRLMKGFGIVHTHNTAPQLFAAIANIFGKQTLITTEHNTTNRRRDKWYLKPGDLWMYHQYKRIICISDQARENLVEYVGDNPKIITIYNGIDVSQFAHAQLIFKNNANVKTITMIAAFRAQKDQKTLIKAFDLLPDNYLLQLVGEGELRKETEEWSRQFACADRIKFLGNRSDVPELMKSSDVVVLSSHYEGLSLSSLEGMASGRPFIASDVDGLHEIVSGFGIIVPHENEIALADSIIKVTTDKDYAQDVILRCTERVKLFDISIMLRLYNDVYYGKL